MFLVLQRSVEDVCRSKSFSNLNWLILASLQYSLKYSSAFLLLMLVSFRCAAQQPKVLLDKGWAEMIQDNDTAALHYFHLAYTLARQQQDTESVAKSLLKMGICYYGVSYSKGLQYAQLAMKEFEKLKPTQPWKALEGRGMCLQLISTVYSRQGKYREAINLSLEAMRDFPKGKDTTAYLGLIYNSLGGSYLQLGLEDSAIYYHRLALNERERANDLVYLPGSYLAIGDIELDKGRAPQSLYYYQRALAIADSTHNRQAQVTALIGLGRWRLRFPKDIAGAEADFNKALVIAGTLTDKVFSIKALSQLMELKQRSKDYKQAFRYKETIDQINDTLHSWEQQKALQILEVQFDIAEKNRQLELARKEQEVTRLTNYMLAGFLSVIIIIGSIIVIFLRRINRRDKQLLQTKEELIRLTEEQKQLREQQMQNEIEFKESQLSAMTLQMVQKNELLQELKEKLDKHKITSQDQSIHKIINKGLNQDKDWSDFNTYFESINKNFYTRLKQAYPDISLNDLKICALIKMNLSIKEMAAVLNISPDSVKTSRYRLRKKLQMNTEDNLTDFILTL